MISKRPGMEIQHVADILADLAHRAAAGGTGAIRSMDDLPAWQVIGQWAPTGRLLSRGRALALVISCRGGRFDRQRPAGGLALQLVKHQLQLLDDAVDLLRGTPELLTAQPRDLDLQFTHYCGWTRDGRFIVKHKTQSQRLTRKLKALRQEAWRLMHAPLAEQHRWYSSILRGHYGYFGMPHNWRALSGF
jgi:hypothetical protein